MSTVLDYEIVDSQKYVCQKNHQINNIKEKKSKFWLSQHEYKQIIVKLKFFSPSKIKNIEIKTHNTQQVQMDFFYQGKRRDQHIFKYDAKHQQITVRPINSDLVDEIALRFVSAIQRKMGLAYLIFKGQPIQKKGSIPKNLTKNHQIAPFEIMNIGKKKQKTAKIFDKRKKQGKSDSEQEWKNQQKKQKQKTSNNHNDEQAQFQKVLKESQRQFKEQQIRNTNIEYQMMEQPPQKYKTKLLTSEIRNVFKFVNLQWIQAQKLKQSQKRVKDQHRLSKYIKVKHLHNKNIFLYGLFGQEKSKLVEIAIDLGAKIVDDPVEQCLILTKSYDSQNFGNWRKIKGVKIIKPQFLEDCHKNNAKLDEKDYFIK